MPNASCHRAFSQIPPNRDATIMVLNQRFFCMHENTAFLFRGWSLNTPLKALIFDASRPCKSPISMVAKVAAQAAANIVKLFVQTFVLQTIPFLDLELWQQYHKTQSGKTRIQSLWSHTRESKHFIFLQEASQQVFTRQQSLNLICVWEACGTTPFLKYILAVSTANYVLLMR